MMSYSTVNADILRTLRMPGVGYWSLLGVLTCVLLFGVFAFWTQVQQGMGVAGYEHPILWAIYITNFVFWVGIAHSGTLISAVLFLFRARWRTAVARAAETMTVFAVMTAGLFPIIHIGRPWFFYWLIPYPNERQLWVNFRSPLVWDLFAISTYLTVSALFLFIGLVPDIAAARDHVKDWRRSVYRVLALGWQGTSRQWRHYNSLYGFFAALATPLVVSVHSVVSWDFAMSILPGWHSTIFAPYFVAGAILSGLGMVITILIPLRKWLGLEEYIRVWHFENLAKLIIMTSSIVGYAYLTEYFIAWYSGSPFEQGTFLDRMFGQYAPLAWMMLLCNAAIPQLLFVKKIRTNLAALFVISIFINIGMWLERYVIIVSSLSHGFDPANWTDSLYSPTWIEGAITAGSFALFFLLFLLFVKNFPAISITEMKESQGQPAEAEPATVWPEPV
jgi:molybdopterin-containing oxidoreductase family membrane subunit